MTMRIFYFATVMVTSLSMAMAFSHLLQMPVRLELDSDAWLTTQQLFPYYAAIGGFIEIGAILMACICAFVLRGRQPAFVLTLIAAMCLAIAFAVWLILVAPANSQIAQWVDTQVPAAWEAWRTQWEFGHAIRASLLISGLGLLVFALAENADFARRTS